MEEKEEKWKWYLMLRDTNPEMVMAWLDAFSEMGPWSIGSNSILSQKADAIVSPANSYGYMDGGIDLAYRNHFGLGLQNRLQKLLAEKYDGFLAVGQAIIISTLNERIPHMIVAPTMEKPSNVSKTNNAYLAMSAVLKVVTEFNLKSSEHTQSSIYRILVPGLATGIGRMDVDISAKQMKQAVSQALTS
jgi:O-acetyl-ADP-ribose deacetylase (regulator of RNase III)